MADDRTVTYAELDERAARVARRLAARGVVPGDRVGTTLPGGVAFAEVLHALPRLGAVLVTGRSLPCKLVVDEPVEGDEEEAVELRGEVDPSETHSVIITSGTTGEPKPVELSYANHLASATASGTVLGVDAGDRWFSPLPVHHIGGLAVLLRSVIYRTTAVLHSRLDAEAAARTLAGGDVTLASLVSTMLVRMREAGLESAPSVRAVLLGGGPAPADLLEWAAEQGLPVRTTYGMTEAASQIATAEPGERAAHPLPGVEVVIGEGGEILVRGPMVSSGTLADDGWLHTGDRGRLDMEGRLVVEGRLKNVIVTGGENVGAEEVEAALLDHPAVREAAVTGLPDPEWGEAVSAYVVLDRAATEEDLKAHCRDRLAPFKVPKRIEQVRALPRNPAGKLLRDELLP